MLRRRGLRVRRAAAAARHAGALPARNGGARPLRAPARLRVARATGASSTGCSWRAATPSRSPSRRTSITRIAPGRRPSGSAGPVADSGERRLPAAEASLAAVIRRFELRRRAPRLRGERRRAPAGDGPRGGLGTLGLRPPEAPSGGALHRRCARSARPRRLHRRGRTILERRDRRRACRAREDAAPAPTLFGHSFGGLIAAAAATRADRLSGLVLYEPPMGGVLRDPAVGHGAEALLAAADRERALPTSSTTSAGTPTPRSTRCAPRPVWAARLDTGPRWCASCGRSTLPLPADELSGLAVPTLMLVGSESPDWAAARRRPTPPPSRAPPW